MEGFSLPPLQVPPGTPSSVRSPTSVASTSLFFGQPEQCSPYSASQPPPSGGSPNHNQSHNHRQTPQGHEAEGDVVLLFHCDQRSRDHHNYSASALASHSTLQRAPSSHSAALNMSDHPMNQTNVSLNASDRNHRLAHNFARAQFQLSQSRPSASLLLNNSNASQPAAASTPGCDAMLAYQASLSQAPTGVVSHQQGPAHPITRARDPAAEQSPASSHQGTHFAFAGSQTPLPPGYISSTAAMASRARPNAVSLPHQMMPSPQVASFSSMPVSQGPFNCIGIDPYDDVMRRVLAVYSPQFMQDFVPKHEHVIPRILCLPTANQGSFVPPYTPSGPYGPDCLLTSPFNATQQVLTPQANQHFFPPAQQGPVHPQSSAFLHQDFAASVPASTSHQVPTAQGIDSSMAAYQQPAYHQPELINAPSSSNPLLDGPSSSLLGSHPLPNSAAANSISSLPTVATPQLPLPIPGVPSSLPATPVNLPLLPPSAWGHALPALDLVPHEPTAISLPNQDARGTKRVHSELMDDDHVMGSSPSSSGDSDESAEGADLHSNDHTPETACELGFGVDDRKIGPIPTQSFMLPPLESGRESPDPSTDQSMDPLQSLLLSCGRVTAHTNPAPPPTFIDCGDAQAEDEDGQEEDDEYDSPEADGDAGQEEDEKGAEAQELEAAEPEEEEESEDNAPTSPPPPKRQKRTKKSSGKLVHASPAKPKEPPAFKALTHESAKLGVKPLSSSVLKCRGKKFGVNASMIELRDMRHHPLIASKDPVTDDEYAVGHLYSTYQPKSQTFIRLTNCNGEVCDIDMPHDIAEVKPDGSARIYVPPVLKTTLRHCPSEQKKGIEAYPFKVVLGPYYFPFFFVPRPRKKRNPQSPVSTPSPAPPARPKGRPSKAKLNAASGTAEPAPAEKAPTGRGKRCSR